MILCSKRGRNKFYLSFEFLFSMHQNLTDFLIASATLSLVGRYNVSNTQGNGESIPQTRTGGDSNRRKHCFTILAVISAPNPLVIGASWLTRRRPVLLTEFSTILLSQGMRVRKSMSSQEIPSLSMTSLAAASNTPTC